MQESLPPNSARRIVLGLSAVCFGLMKICLSGLRAAFNVQKLKHVNRLMYSMLLLLLCRPRGEEDVGSSVPNFWPLLKAGCNLQAVLGFRVWG